MPRDWAIDAHMVDVDVDGGTPGSELHGNPLYAGRGVAIFTMSLASVMIGAWDVFQEDIWQTVGASAARDDARLTRIVRDMATAIAHRNPQQRGFLYGEIARGALALPRRQMGI